MRTLAIVVAAVIAGAVATRASAPVAPAGPVDDGGAAYRITAAEAESAGVSVLAEADRAAGATFAPGTSPLDARIYSDAIAAARPDAQQLIGVVDGLTTVSFGPVHEGSIGVTRMRDGRFDVRIDLGRVRAEYGQRGITRVVLHELGHVVDHAILPDATVDQLDRGIPAGHPCAPGEHTGSCAGREERFAETFAKWATGDIGVNLYVGYAVPPPSMTLDAWGTPLAELAASLSRP